MALFDIDTRTLLKNIVAECDYSSCLDLQLEMGSNEDSVTQNLVKEIRKKVFTKLAELNNDVKIKLFAQKTPKKDETGWGVDAIIIIYDHDMSVGKICLFEAKIDKPNWDKLEENSKKSHFSSQLSRQIVPYNDGCVIWEQFYKGPETLPEGSVRSISHSTCIFHQDAINHNPTHPNNIVWKVGDIDSLALKAKLNNKSTSMGEIIKQVCECSYGKEKNIDDILFFVRNMPVIPSVLIIEKSPTELRNKIFISLTERKYEEFKDDLKRNKIHRRKF